MQPEILQKIPPARNLARRRPKAHLIALQVFCAV
jgi:hypothetical protein